WPISRRDRPLNERRATPGVYSGVFAEYRGENSSRLRRRLVSLLRLTSPDFRRALDELKAKSAGALPASNVRLGCFHPRVSDNVRRARPNNGHLRTTIDCVGD